MKLFKNIATIYQLDQEVLTFCSGNNNKTNNDQ